MEPISRSNKSFEISIVVDHSASMEEDPSQLYDKDGKKLYSIYANDNIVVPASYISPMENVQKALTGFVKAFDMKKDKIAMTAFSNSVDQEMNLTSNAKNIQQFLTSIKPQGKTALYDGMIKGIEKISAQSQSVKALVVFTDGQDNKSISNAEQVIYTALKSGVPIYIIGFGDVNTQALGQIADATNGRFYYTKSSMNLKDMYAMISDELKAYYHLIYQSPIAFDATQKITASININNQNVQTTLYYTEPADMPKVMQTAPATQQSKANAMPAKNTTKKVAIDKSNHKPIRQSAFLKSIKVAGATENLFSLYLMLSFIASFLLYFRKSNAMLKH
jgi:hypothetical protein